MIQPALQSERPPADRFRRHIGDQRVTGWSPQPFAEAIDDAQADDLPRRRGGRDDGPYGGRDEVADDDQRPAAASAAPSSAPSATAPPPSTPVTNAGSSGYTISLAKSLSRETAPNSLTCRGSACRSLTQAESPAN